MDILGQSALILAVVAFSLALTALSRNLRNKLVLTYALLCTVICGWALFFFLEKIFRTGGFYQIHLIFNLLLAPIGLLFIRVLTRVDTKFTRWMNSLSILYSATTAVLLLSRWGVTPVVRNLSFFAPSFLMLECLHLMYRERQLQKGVLSNIKIQTLGLAKRTWIYIGAFVLLSICTMNHIRIFGDVVPSLGNLLLCPYLFVISEAIIHQRLLNWSALITRVFVLVVISFVLTVIYTTFVAWIETSPALFLLNTFIASFVILMLIDPVKKLTGLAAVKLLSQKDWDLEQKIQEAQLQLTGVLDTQGLAQLTLHFLESALSYDSATFFLLRSDGTKFKRIRGIRDDDLVNREILSNHPVVQFFARMKRRGEAPVLLDYYLENEIDRSTSQAQRQMYEHALKGLEGLNANIAIPFMDGVSVLAFVVINAKNPPEPWGNSWGVLSAIYPFFTYATRTLQNMDVYVRLREKDRLAALGEMAAGLAHEIRNPLGAIKGAAQYLETNTEIESEKSPFLKVIVEEVNRLNKVVVQFLDYSRPQTPKLDLKEFDVGTILERTHVLFQSAHTPGIDIKLRQPDEGLHSLPKVACVPEQIKQVLVNLVQNSMGAIQKKENGKGTVLIGARVEESRDHKKNVVLYVEDDGPGIAREHLEKIFIPFFTTSPSGTGLGLPICARIIEAHGGRIDVASEEGRFTRFSVYLPTVERVIHA